MSYNQGETQQQINYTSYRRTIKRENNTQSEIDCLKYFSGIRDTNDTKIIAFGCLKKKTKTERKKIFKDYFVHFGDVKKAFQNLR